MNVKQEETEIGIFRQGNDWQGNGELAELVQRIEAAVAKYRLTFADEKQLQDQLATIFAGAGMVVEREFILSKGERLDFFICGKRSIGEGAAIPSAAGTSARPGFALEVKVGGAVEGHLRQMKRYNEHPQVLGTILIATRKYDLPESLAGKPVAGINVGGNRL